MHQIVPANGIIGRDHLFDNYKEQAFVFCSIAV